MRESKHFQAFPLSDKKAFMDSVEDKPRIVNRNAKAKCRLAGFAGSDRELCAKAFFLAVVTSRVDHT